MQLPEWIRQMATRRTTRAADTLEGGEDLDRKPKPTKPPEGPVVEPEPDPLEPPEGPVIEPEPELPEPPEPPAPPEGGGEDLQPGLPGSEVPQCDPGTPGYIQGIAERPETEEEHNARLGEAAGTVVDVGHLMGTAAGPRPNWPAMPVEVPEPPPAPVASSAALPELELVMKPVADAEPTPTAKVLPH
jgi:hypothetical protein